jgi:glutamyl-tRNA reductase
MELKQKIINARVTYRNIPIHKLERVIFPDIDDAYKQLINTGLNECVIIETCNRVEVYGVADNDYDPSNISHTWLDICKLDINELRLIELSIDNDAIIHLLRLASGLDSIVIGEDQILSQVKRAYEYAKEKGYTGKYLSLIFDKAIRVGGKVRANTGINKGSVSYGSMAVRLAEEHLNGLRNRKIMLIGSGEAASMIAKALKNRNIDFLITSRTINRAKSFANRIGGKPIRFEDALDMIKDLDLLFIATTAPYYLITYDKMKSIKRDMLIIDLSNPKTVEDKVREVCKVIDIDDIAKSVEMNFRSRLEEVNDAESIVLEEAMMLTSRLRRLEITPFIDSLFKEADKIREKELSKALDMLGDITEEQRRIIERMSMSIVEGILSNPMDNLRKASEQGDKELINIINRLFKYE